MYIRVFIEREKGRVGGPAPVAQLDVVLCPSGLMGWAHAWVGTRLGGRSDPSQGICGATGLMSLSHQGSSRPPSLGSAAGSSLSSPTWAASPRPPQLQPALCPRGTAPGRAGVCSPQPGSPYATALTETDLSVGPAWWGPGQPSFQPCLSLPWAGPSLKDLYVGWPGDRAGAPSCPPWFGQPQEGETFMLVPRMPG